MTIAKTEKIWMNGRWVAWDEAKVHVMTHALHYASAVFEGIRAYETADGPAVFRLDDHIDRLLFSARVYRMEVPYTAQQVHQACCEVVTVNRLGDCYIRPLIYRGYENIGVNPFGNPIDVAIAAYPWGQYLGPDALTKGVAVKISTWQRPAPNTLPVMAKAAANYMNSQLSKMEAIVDGYAEAISLDTNGFVSEGSGQNVFAVIKGEVVTPPLHSSILAGITRSTVLALAQDLGLRVREQTLPRESLYAADELFFSGTAVEISPIGSIDRITIGNGGRGPITKQIQESYFDAVRGKLPKHRDWLTLVRPAAQAATPAAAPVAAAARPS
jgi:branched-chain amino acid aminotransferase